jgi:hypothetical protein
MHLPRSIMLALLCLAAPPASWAQTSQTIRLYPVPPQVVGNAPFQIIALDTSGLPLTLTVSGPATIYRRALTLTGPGTVTITATQAGNGSYAPATAQESFLVNPAQPVVAWTPPTTLVYGTPLDTTILTAVATAVPMVNATADVSTLTSQLDISAVTGSSTPNTPDTDPDLRFEGSLMAPSPIPNDKSGLIEDGSVTPHSNSYRIEFTCNCQQFEWVMQSRQSTYRLWVDGQWTTSGEISPDDHYPERAFYHVQFPDKRPRQILIQLKGNPPFFGFNLVGDDTIGPPQTTHGPRVIIMGDSWTGATFDPPLLPPAQDGLNGSGFAQLLGEFFGWDYWETPSGGEGFTDPGTAQEPYAQRALTDICGQSPTAAVIVGGVNDGDITAAQEEQGALNLVSNLQGCLPNMPVYIFGPQQTEPIPNAGLQAAALLYPPNVLYGDMSPDDTNSTPANWIYGAYDDNTVGNAYVYIGVHEGAEGHPTPLGYDYVAARMEDAILTRYPQLTPTASTLFQPAPVAGTISYSAQPGDLLPVGQQTVIARFAPSDATDYTPATTQATILIQKATTNGQLTVQPATDGLQLQVQEIPQLSGIPTGTVTFFNSTTNLGSATLINGSATLSINHSLQAAAPLIVQYTGDSNFLGSTGSATVPTPDFQLLLQQSQITIKSGQSGTVQLLVTPINDLNATLQLTCAGLPQYASCSTTGVSVTGSPATFPIVISTIQQPTTAALQRPAGPSGPFTLAKSAGTSAAIGLCALVLLPFRRRLQHARAALLLGLLAVAGLCLSAGMLTGCASSAVTNDAITTPGTYNVTVTLSQPAAAGATTTLQHTQTLKLIVN